MTELMSEALPTAGERLEMGGGISRGQLARRVQRVLADLLMADRWPQADQLAATLVPLVGAVLRTHRLTKADRAAAIKVAGAAAAYCWEFLPDTSWSWHPLPASFDQSAPRPLVWRSSDGELVGDVLLAGLHRDPLASGLARADELRHQYKSMSEQVDAVRLLPLLSPMKALLITWTSATDPVDALHTPNNAHASPFTAAALASSRLAGIGGIER